MFGNKTRLINSLGCEIDKLKKRDLLREKDFSNLYDQLSECKTIDEVREVIKKQPNVFIRTECLKNTKIVNDRIIVFGTAIGKYTTTGILDNSTAVHHIRNNAGEKMHGRYEPLSPGHTAGISTDKTPENIAPEKINDPDKEV